MADLSWQGIANEWNKMHPDQKISRTTAMNVHDAAMEKIRLALNKDKELTAIFKDELGMLDSDPIAKDEQ